MSQHRVPVANTVQADDSVVPVTFVPINPITFVHAVAAASPSSAVTAPSSASATTTSTSVSSSSAVSAPSLVSS